MQSRKPVATRAEDARQARTACQVEQSGGRWPQRGCRVDGWGVYMAHWGVTNGAYYRPKQSGYHGKQHAAAHGVTLACGMESMATTAIAVIRNGGSV
jgi:hypothetical protein